MFEEMTGAETAERLMAFVGFVMLFANVVTQFMSNKTKNWSGLAKFVSGFLNTLAGNIGNNVNAK